MFNQSWWRTTSIIFKFSIAAERQLLLANDDVIVNRQDNGLLQNHRIWSSEIASKITVDLVNFFWLNRFIDAPKHVRTAIVCRYGSWAHNLGQPDDATCGAGACFSIEQDCSRILRQCRFAYCQINASSCRLVAVFIVANSRNTKSIATSCWRGNNDIVTHRCSNNGLLHELLDSCRDGQLLILRVEFTVVAVVVLLPQLLLLLLDHHHLLRERVRRATVAALLYYYCYWLLVLLLLSFILDQQLLLRLLLFIILFCFLIGIIAQFACCTASNMRQIKFLDRRMNQHVPKLIWLFGNR